MFCCVEVIRGFCEIYKLFNRTVMIHTGYVEKKKYLKDKNALIGKVWLLVKCLFLLMH